MTKKVLFVTYGGGHVMMVAPVVRALASYPNIKTETLALTTGGVYFKNQGLPYKGFKDFVTKEDEDAIKYGKKLAEHDHNPSSGIDEEETIAYLGLSYQDLVTQHGKAEAAKLWETHKRNAFLPVSVMERIIERINPDMVVTTNSPRCEMAAVLAANKLGIPTMSMVDLFGILNLHKLEANYITVLSQQVAENIKNDGGSHTGQQFIVTGNPAFDQAFEYRGAINYDWRKKHFPTLPDNAKALLWIDDSGYFDAKTNRTHFYNAQEIAKNLDSLARATAANNCCLLIRPHPSQDRKIFETWINNSAHPHVLFAGDVPLYPLLNACDAVAIYQSTVGLEALIMRRPVIQLKYYPGRNAVPLGDMGVAHIVEKPKDLPEILRETLNQKNSDAMWKSVDKIFPKEKAAPKIAAAINSILQ